MLQIIYCDELTGQTGSMALACRTIKLSNTNYPDQLLCGPVCLKLLKGRQPGDSNEAVIYSNGKLKKWFPNAVLLKPMK